MYRAGLRPAAGDNVRTDPDTTHTTAPTCTPTTPVGTALMLTPNVAYMVIPSGGNSWSSRSRPGTVSPDVIVNGR